MKQILKALDGTRQSFLKVASAGLKRRQIGLLASLKVMNDTYHDHKENIIHSVNTVCSLVNCFFFNHICNVQFA